MSAGAASGAADVPADIPAEPLATRDDLRRLLLDQVPIIDVRAPVEFARGCVPGAVNLPLMNDEERHLVGIRYKQAGQDKAIELGAELVGENSRQQRTAAWRNYVDAHPDAVICCFRGGLRSRIAQAWLADAGVVRPLVSGGFKALRQCLIDELDRLCETTPFTLLAGRTGSGKTLLLRRLSRYIDLEGIAHHRGSSFGGMAGPQPGPIDVEHAITRELMQHEAGEPEASDAERAAVWLEDEAKLIGRVCLPPALRDAMTRSSAVVLDTPMQVRINTCFDDYVPDLLARYVAAADAVAASTDVRHEGFEAFAAHHRGSLDRIRKRLGGERHAEASALLESALTAHRVHDDTSGYAPFIELLLTRYYDPMYDYQLGQKQRRILFRGDADAILAWDAERSATQ